MNIIKETRGTTIIFPIHPRRLIDHTKSISMGNVPRLAQMLGSIYLNIIQVVLLNLDTKASEVRAIRTIQVNAP